MTSLKSTPLLEMHRKLKARIVPFAGWSMPIQYEGVIPEHLAVRNVQLVAGENRLRVYGFSPLIVESSIHLRGLAAPQDLRLLEQRAGILGVVHRHRQQRAPSRRVAETTLRALTRR